MELQLKDLTNFGPNHEFFDSFGSIPSKETSPKIISWTEVEKQFVDSALKSNLTLMDFPKSGFVHSSLTSDCPDYAQFYSKRKKEDLCELLLLLRELETQEKYQGMEGMVVNKNSVTEAYTVANCWPDSIQTPVLDIDDHGIVSLFIFDDEGSSLAEIEFYCGEHMASYSILHRSKQDADCGYLDTTSDVLKFFRLFEEIWGK